MASARDGFIRFIDVGFTPSSTRDVDSIAIEGRRDGEEIGLGLSLRWYIEAAS